MSRFNPLTAHTAPDEAALTSALQRAAEQPAKRKGSKRKPEAAAKPTPSESKPVAPAVTPVTAVAVPTLTENEEKNGYEIRFPSKPSDAQRQRLVDEGWRFLPNRYVDPLWYRRRSPQARAFAVAFVTECGGKANLKDSPAPPVALPVFMVPEISIPVPVQRKPEVGRDGWTVNKPHLLAIALLRKFIGKDQLQAIVDALQGEEGDYFKAKLVEMAGIVKAMPHSYQTDGQGDSAVVHLHYFKGGADWFIIEKDGGHSTDEVKGEQHQAFGLADLFGDGGELGYISIAELIANGVELDLHWTPKTLGQVRGARASAKRHTMQNQLEAA